MKAERADAQAAGGREEVEGLDGQIAALESALKERSGAADTGERARDNVRKAVAVVMEQLREGGPEEKAFAEHLRNHLSIGHECLYSQPEGTNLGVKSEVRRLEAKETTIGPREAQVCKARVLAYQT